MVLGLLLSALALQSPARAADAAFTQFIASLWPEAQAAGISRETPAACASGHSEAMNCVNAASAARAGACSAGIRSNRPKAIRLNRNDLLTRRFRLCAYGES